MNVEIITKEDLLEFRKEFIEEIKEIINPGLQQTEWLSTDEAMTLLWIKGKTKLQNLRDNLAIKFSQHGRIIKYSRSSILEFLEKNTIKF